MTNFNYAYLSFPVPGTGNFLSTTCSRRSYRKVGPFGESLHLIMSERKQVVQEAKLSLG